MAVGLDTGTLVMAGIIIAVIVIILSFITKKKGGGFKDFISKTAERLFTDSINNKLKIYGKKIKKGKLVIGFNVIGHVESYYETKGEFPLFEIENDEFKPITNKEGELETMEYDLVFFKMKNKFFLLRWLGLKKSYFIIRNKDEDGNKLIKFDVKTNRFILPRGIDFFQYGNIWTESIDARTYLNNISMLFELQQQQTHLQNTPDRAVHLEIEQAKKERTFRTLSEIDRAKYDAIKKAEDELIS